MKNHFHPNGVALNLALKQRLGNSEIAYPGSWTLFLCKRFLLFQQLCINAGRGSENVP